jgi:hypothetical protein
MRLVHAARHLSVSIERPPADVYAFASNPANLPLWAKGLSGSIANVDGEWVGDSPMGRVKVRFVPPNPHGVLDHDVELETGETVHVPLRVVPNGAGSELVFTLVRRRGVTDEEFDADANAIQRDLGALKALLEQR